MMDRFACSNILIEQVYTFQFLIKQLLISKISVLLVWVRFMQSEIAWSYMWLLIIWISNSQPFGSWVPPKSKFFPKIGPPSKNFNQNCTHKYVIGSK